MIAPFWADLDNRPGDQSKDSFNQIFWRLDKSIATLRTLAKTVRDNSADRNFKPDWAIVATWFKVGYYKQHFDLKNTFQVVLSCEGEKVCYCFFSYDQIEWTDSDVQHVHAQAGFNDVNGKKIFFDGLTA